MTTIYGSDGSSVGRSSGKVSERSQRNLAAMTPAVELSKGKLASEPDARDSMRVPANATDKSFIRVRKLRAKPVDVERLKADNQRVKEMRERMRRLRESAAD